MDGVGGVVMIGGGELPELRPEFGGQVPLVEGEPAVGYGWLKGFDSVFFVLVLFVIHDSVLKAVSLFHRAEGVVGRHLDGAVCVGALFAYKVGFRVRRRQHRLGALCEEDGRGENGEMQLSEREVWGLSEWDLYRTGLGCATEWAREEDPYRSRYSLH